MKRILFLMSDTGGGHRAAARAISAALDIRYPDQYSYELVDLWKHYTPPPFNRMPETYTHWVNTSLHTYAAQYWVNDRVLRVKPFSDLYTWLLYTRMKRMYKTHPCDMVVCVHSVFVRPAVHALRQLKLNMPFVTVITDYALPVVLWYDPRADTTLVPTQPAYERGLRLGMPPEKMILTGAPIHPKFIGLKITKAEARDQLGWPQESRIALMVGGGDGMGPLVDTARAIDAQDLPANCELTVIAGRNAEMKAHLEAIRWRRKTRIYGFVDNMQVFMRAADLLITKAGPATITEAAEIGVPMVISGAIPFQESPNTQYVVKLGAGVYAPGPQKVAESIGRIFGGDGKELAAMAESVRKLAYPDAIWRIADEIHAHAPNR